MYMKRSILIFVLFFALTAPVQAQELSPTLRATLIQQLQVLLKQVVSLQTQLEQLRAMHSVDSQNDLYPTNFYTGTYEAVYTVKDLTLSPILPTEVRTGDKALFETFIDLAGEDFVRTYVLEFRVFNDLDNEFGAFVQQKKNRTWILAVNRFDEDLGVTHVNKSVTDLLLHEYGHIVFFEDIQIAEDFVSSYWERSVMQQHLNALSTLTDTNERFAVTAGFYQRHQELFVSEYAASSPDEDLVESFTTFVLNDKPTGNSVWEQKILFFYKNPQMTQLRSQLRNSGVLTI
jgi:hypothetical protein